MFDKLKHNILPLELILGSLVYFFIIAKSGFSPAIIWMMFIVYLWLLSSIYLKQYRLSSFLFIVSISGIILSISLFFIQGVEQLPYPEGALMFNIDGIAKSLLVFLICTTPFLLIKNNKNDSTVSPGFSGTKQRNKEEAWEEATEEDLQSGGYEPL